MFDIQSFAFFALHLAAIIGAALQGVTLSPPSLPPHVCGVPPAVLSGNHVVDDWVQDPRHPIGYIAYPPIASRHNEQGVSTVTICIMPDGWVGDVALKVSSGSQQLDAVTLISAGDWHFRPARGGINGVPEWADVGVRYVMPEIPVGAVPPVLGPAPVLKFGGGEATRPVPDPAFPHRATYPSLALRRGEEGAVILSFDVEDDGWPSQVRVAHSSGSQQLDAMALVNVGYWHYFPVTKAAAPTRARWLTRVNFKLVDGQNRRDSKR